MRLRLSVLIALLASILLASSAFADTSAKGTQLDPAAKYAPANTHRTLPVRSSNNLDEVLVSTSFEDATFPPTGWTRTITNAAYPWTTAAAAGGLGGYDGNEAASCVYDPDLHLQDEWLISPAFDMSSTANSYQVSFWWNSSYYWGVTPYDNYDIEVRISLNGGSSWETDVLWVEDDYGTFVTFDWYPATVSLNQYAGQANVKLAWRYVGTDGAQAQVDLVSVESIAPGGTLTGTVTDAASSAPIAGVTVTVVGEGSTTTTGATGVYTLNDVVPGTYTVNFTKNAYEPASAADVVITLGQSTTQNMTMNALPVIDNDDCDSPYDLGSQLGLFPYSTTSATLDASTAELPQSCQEGTSPLTFAADVWVSWIAPGTGLATFSTCDDADYDTRLACYSTGNATCAPCPTTNEYFHACNDDGEGCGTTSLMPFDVVNGACYLVRLGGYGTLTGTGNITVTFEAAPLPVLTLTPADTMDFGGVAVDGSAQLTLSLENTGAAVLQVTSITVPDGYSVTPSAHGIPIGQTRTSTITFAPTAAQVYSGYITVTSNDENSPHTVYITGSGTEDADDVTGLVTEYYVATSYPNPFNPETTISFAIPKAEQVSVVIFNTVGQEVAVLNNGRLDAGVHSFTFNGADLPSGIYFTRIEADGFSQTLKNVLMK